MHVDKFVQVKKSIRFDRIKSLKYGEGPGERVVLFTRPQIALQPLARLLKYFKSILRPQQKCFPSKILSPIFWIGLKKISI